MKYVIILGLARSGTSYLTKCIHDAGIPMWRQPPGTEHCEDPAAIGAFDQLALGNGDRYLWRLRGFCEASDVWPCGFKEPHLVNWRPYVTGVFPPEDSRYIICYRRFNPAAESFSRLSGDPIEVAREYYRRSTINALGWIKHHPASVTLFDYDGDIETQQKELSEVLGRPIDILTNWKRHEKPSHHQCSGGQVVSERAGEATEQPEPARPQQRCESDVVRQLPGEQPDAPTEAVCV